MLLEIKDLHAAIDGKEILKGLNLQIKKGEVHAIMGPNGSGKSTLAKILAGHPSYEVTKGEVLYEGKEFARIGTRRTCARRRFSRVSISGRSSGRVEFAVFAARL